MTSSIWVRSSTATAMSRMGLASSPGTEVLPTWATPRASSPSRFHDEGALGDAERLPLRVVGRKAHLGLLQTQLVRHRWSSPFRLLRAIYPPCNR